jgi:hypothetical protein
MHNNVNGLDLEPLTWERDSHFVMPRTIMHGSFLILTDYNYMVAACCTATVDK